MDDLGIFERHGDETDLRYERLYPRPIETVWAALTDPVRLGDWMSPALVEPHLGGRYELFIDRPRPMTGRITVWEPPHRLEFTWDTGDAPETLVRCELSAEDDGTRLIFRHEGMGYAWIGLVLPGWHTHLDRLASLLEGRPEPGSTEEWRRLQHVYLDHYKLEGVMLDPPPGHGD